MANPHFEKFIEVATTSKDSLNFRQQVVIAYKYFIGYNTVIKKDTKAAIEFCDKVLAINPSDAQALEFKRQLSGGKQASNTSTSTSAPSTGTKPAAGKPAGGSAPQKK